MSDREIPASFEARRLRLMKTAHHGTPLAMQAKGPWPTPRGAEWKGVGPLGSPSQDYRLDRKYLDATVQEEQRATGRLNPAWVEQLMGWEDGWTSLPDGRWDEVQRSIHGKRRASRQASKKAASTG
jgi:hypothetical protein